MANFFDQFTDQQPVAPAPSRPAEGGFFVGEAARRPVADTTPSNFFDRYVDGPEDPAAGNMMDNGVVDIPAHPVDESLSRPAHAANEFVRGAAQVAAADPLKAIGAVDAMMTDASYNTQKKAADYWSSMIGDIDERLKGEADPGNVEKLRFARKDAAEKLVDAQEGMRKWSSQREPNSGAETTGMYQRGKAVQDAVEEQFPVNPDYRGEFFADQLAAGGGSMAGFVAGGVGGQLLKAPAWIAPLLMGAASGGVGGYEDARREGADPDTAYTSFLLNAGLGTSEAVPISNALDRLDKVTGGGLKRIIMNGFKGGLEELIQEAGQTLGANVVARAFYDADRELTEGVQEGAQVGGALGFMLSALMSVPGARRRSDVQAVTDEEAQPEQQRAAEQVVSDYLSPSQPVPERAEAPVLQQPAPGVTAPEGALPPAPPAPSAPIEGAPAAPQLEPAYDQDENGNATDEQVGWIDPATGTVQPMQAEEVPAQPRKRPTRSLDKTDLLYAVAELGGLQDQGGDLNAIFGGVNPFIPGQGRLVREGGRTPDEMREVLVEQGWLPPDADINTMLDLIDQSSRNPVYHSEAVPQGPAMQPEEGGVDPDQIMPEPEIQQREATAEDAAAADAGFGLPFDITPFEQREQQSRSREDAIRFEDETDAEIDRQIREVLAGEWEAPQNDRDFEDIPFDLTDPGPDGPGTRRTDNETEAPARAAGGVASEGYLDARATQEAGAQPESGGTGGQVGPEVADASPSPIEFRPPATPEDARSAVEALDTEISQLEQEIGDGPELQDGPSAVRTINDPRQESFGDILTGGSVELRPEPSGEPGGDADQRPAGVPGPARTNDPAGPADDRLRGSRDRPDAQDAAPVGSEVEQFEQLWEDLHTKREVARAETAKRMRRDPDANEERESAARRAENEAEDAFLEVANISDIETFDFALPGKKTSFKAQIQLGRLPNGRWVERVDYNSPTSGGGGPFGHRHRDMTYDAREEAANVAASKIAEHYKSLAESKISTTSDAEKAGAVKMAQQIERFREERAGPKTARTEQTDQGEQTLIDGVAPVTDRDRIEAQRDKPLQAKKPQREADDGLFDTGARRQTDLLDAAPKSETKHRSGKEWAKAVLSGETELGKVPVSAYQHLAEELGITLKTGNNIEQDRAQLQDALTAGSPTKSAEIQQAAAEAHPEPTEAQKEAGNYKKGHLRYAGLDITIENAKGAERSGTDPDGKPWSVTMPANYGYIKRTEGADGDHVDVYLNDTDREDLPVFVIDQMDAETGKFDEHKVMLGFASKRQALTAYRKGFSDGKADDRLGHAEQMSVEQFRDWLKADTTKPVSEAPPPDTVSAPDTPKTPAPAGVSDSEPMDLKAVQEMSKRLNSGEMTPAEYREAFERLLDNEQAIKTDLSKTKTVPQLRRISGTFRNDYKKAELVDQTFERFVTMFHPGDGMISYNMNETLLEVVKRDVRNATDADLEVDIKRRKESIDKRTADKEDRERRMDDPKELRDFYDLIQFRGDKALKDLPDEKKALYDDLVAEDKRKHDEAARKRSAEVKGVNAGDVDTEIIETKHTQKGHDLFVVKLSERVEKDTYRELVAAAKKLGGYYSRYAKGDAVPGFQFKSKDAAEQFQAIAKGETVSRADQIEARQDEKRQSAADKLRGMADSLQEKAEEALNADRKTNTHRRADMAASAEDKARYDIKIAETMRNLAEAADAGELKHLADLRNKVQIELLDRQLRRAVYEADRNLTYSEREKRKGRPVEDSDIQAVKFPERDAHVETAISVGEIAKDIAGAKRAARNVLKRAKDLQSRDKHRITFTRPYGPGQMEDIQTVLHAVKKKDPKNWPAESIENGFADAGRLERMGVKDSASLRAALREFLKHRAGARKADPLVAMERALIGKKIDGYFPTPTPLVDRMIDEAGIEKGMDVLEPSAGKGNIADRLKDEGGNLTAIEINSNLRDVLKAKGHNLLDERNFLEHTGKYDRIVMNPPFENAQDIDHVRHAYDLLKPGGRVVAIMSEGPFFRQDKKAQEFRDWLDENGWSEQNPEGSFKDSDRSTGVATRLVVIDKGGDTKFRAAKAPTKKTEAGDKVRANVARLLDRIAPGAETRFVDELTDGKGRPAYGSTTDAVITLALNAPNVTETARHEAIHFLRNAGKLPGRDWRILKNAARDEGWIAEHGIEARYPDLSEEQRIEEAVAEKYAVWADNRYEAKTRIGKIFSNIKRFLDSVRTGMRRVLGKNPDVRDIFSGIEAGKTGDGPARRDGETRFSLVPPGKDLFQVDTTKPDAGVFDELTSRNKGFLDRVRDATTKRAIRASVDAFRQGFQDRMIYQKRMQEEIEQVRGTPLSEAEDAYLQEELVSGRIENRLKDLENGHIRPLIEQMHDFGISVEEIEQYLYARHAKERNAQIQKINPKFAEEGGGSGMTDEEADDTLREFTKQGKTDKLAAIASRVDEILQANLDGRVEDGLMTAEDAKKWRDTYPSYVPLRGIAELGEDLMTERPNATRGYQARGPESKRALGRETAAQDILAHVFTIAQEGVIRGEKNRVFKSFYDLASKNPSEAWEINKTSHVHTLNKRTGLVELKPAWNSPLDEETTVRGKIEGKEVRITVADLRIAHALKNMDSDGMHRLIRFMHSITRYLSSINTGWNPEFIVTNFIRDIQTATINSAALDTKGLAKGVAKDWRKAMAGAGRYLIAGKTDTEWSRYMREYEEVGGKVAFWKLETVQDQKKAIDAITESLKGGKWAKAKSGFNTAIEFIENVNLTVDNAIRLAVFVNARRAGVSEKRAASIAKNITVNFNRRGAHGPTMNALFMFSNAGIQGTARLAQLLTNRRGRKIVFGIVAAGAAWEFLASLMSPEDDDGELLYDKVGSSKEGGDYLKFRNIIIPVSKDIDKDGYVKIPLPLGLNWFFNMGRLPMAVWRGQMKPGEAVANLFGTAADMFSPIGSDSNIFNTLTPSVVKPLSELGTNENFMGTPVYPEPFPTDMSPKPSSERYFRSVSEPSKAVSKWLNEITGGDSVREGAVSITPEAFDHIIGYYLGGTGRFFGQLADLPAKAAKGEARIADVPFIRKVYGTKSEWRDKGDAYDNIHEILALEGYFKDYVKIGDDTGKAELRRDPLFALVPRAKAVKKGLRANRKERLAAEAKDDDARLEEIAEREKALVTSFNRLVNRARKPKQE